MHTPRVSFVRCACVLLTLLSCSWARAQSSEPPSDRASLALQSSWSDGPPSFTQAPDTPLASPIPFHTGQAWVTLGAYLNTRTAQSEQREFGGLVLVNLPVERWFQARPAVAQSSAPSAWTQQPPAPKPAAVRVEPAAGTETKKSTLPVSPALVWACVQAAWRAQDPAGAQSLDDLASRARLSSLLPEIRLHAANGVDHSYRLTPTDSDPFRTQELNGTRQWLEARLTWRLDRLLFADEEIAIDRLRQQRQERRLALARQVLTVLFDWQRARLSAADPKLSEPEQLEAMLRQVETQALLDVLTSGWFSRWLGHQAN